MFNTFAYQGVDAIQSVKKQVVSTFVQHEQLQKVLTDFVDAQTAYTKSAIDAGINTFTSMSSLLMHKDFYTKLFTFNGK